MFVLLAKQLMRFPLNVTPFMKLALYLVVHNNFENTLTIRPFYTGSKLNLVSRRSINWSPWIPHFIGFLYKMAEWRVFECKHSKKIV